MAGFSRFDERHGRSCWRGELGRSSDPVTARSPSCRESRLEGDEDWEKRERAGASRRGRPLTALAQISTKMRARKEKPCPLSSSSVSNSQKDRRNEVTTSQNRDHRFARRLSFLSRNDHLALLPPIPPPVSSLPLFSTCYRAAADQLHYLIRSLLRSLPFL